MLVKVQDAAKVLETEGEVAALRYAARLKCLGVYRNRIQRAASAVANPAMYVGMRQDPKALVRDGVEALRQLIAENTEEDA